MLLVSYDLAAAVSTGPDASAANSHGTASLHVATSSIAPAKKVVATVAPTVPKAPSPVSTGKSVTRKITRKIVKYASVDGIRCYNMLHMICICSATNKKNQNLLFNPVFRFCSTYLHGALRSILMSNLWNNEIFAPTTLCFIRHVTYLRKFRIFSS